jgi:hypothetical protein
MPFDSGLCTGVKHGTRPRAAAKSSVSLAVKGLPLSDSHSTACGGSEPTLEPERRPTPFGGTQAVYSLRQLLANAAIAASRVGS